MTRLFIGHKPGVGGVVKVMKNDGDDPLTTPNTDYGKYLFNSETSKIGYLKGLPTISFGGRAEGDYFYPGGTGWSNCLDAIGSWGNFEQHNYYTGRHIGKGDWPAIGEFRPSGSLGTEIEGPIVKYNQTDNDFDNWVGLNEAYPTYRCFMSQRAVRRYTAQDYSAPIVYSERLYSTNDPANEAFNSGTLSIFDLPADNRALPSHPTAGAGSRNTLITPSIVRIAKSGASEGAGGDSVIIDSNAIPLKIVRAGEVVIPAGSSVNITVPVTLGPDSYMDYMVWRDGTACTVPQALNVGNVGSQRLGLKYTIYSTYVRLRNTDSSALRVRYAIFWDDLSTTSGGSAVMRTITGNNVQIKRPGSSDSSPGSGDIMLDTRFAYFPILAEGWFDWNDMSTGSRVSQAYGERGYRVNYNAGGLKPFVKYYVDFRGPGSGSNVGARNPVSKIMRSTRSTSWNGRQTSDGTVAYVTDSYTTFHMSRDNPWYLTMGNPGVNEQYSANFKAWAIRYYIFGIPASL